MMLVATAMVLAQASVPLGAGPVDNVTVTARKLRQLDIELKRRRGTVICKYTRSSGDPALDVAACEISTGCYRRTTKAPELKACITSGLTALIAPHVDPK